MTTIIFILELAALAALTICGALLLLDVGDKKKRPDVNRPGALQPLEVDVAPQATGQAFTYPTPGEEKRAGTYPDVSTIGEMTAPGVNARITGESAGIVYKICGATRL